MARSFTWTHYAYFKERDAAEACGRDLGDRFDCVTHVRRSVVRSDEWLLRAARTVTLGIPWHSDVEEVVKAHGGRYTGGTACIFVRGPLDGA